MQSNYEKMKVQMQREFLKFDQTAMIERFHLWADGTFLTFGFMGGAGRIDRNTGAAACQYGPSAAFREADYNEAMTMYDLLCWSKPDARPSGRFANMQSLSGIQSATAATGQGFFLHEAKLLDHREDALRRALQKLDGKMTDGGDVAAQVPVFCDLNLIFRFWNSDDEFEPEIQFLWDANVLSFMHYETVWFANHALVRRVCEMMAADRRGA